MRSILTEFVIPENTTDRDGLKPGCMTRLPSIVAITGPNGAGKTRLLSRVLQNLDDRPYRMDVNDEIQPFLNRHPGARNGFELQEPLNRADLDLICEEADRLGYRKNLSQTLNPNYVSLRKTWTIEISRLNEGTITTAGKPRLIQLGSRPTKMDEVGTANLNELRASHKPLNMKGSSFGDLFKNALRIIQQVSIEWATATNPSVCYPDEQRLRAEDRYNKLNSLLEILLGTSVSFDAGLTTLFGLPLDEARLSVGQIRLLQLACALFEPGELDDETVIIMDEPENHLHPGAVIDFIDALSSFLKNGQFFIATHSLPLLARLETSNIWCMKEGEVFYAGNKTEEVLTSLVGGEDNIHRVSLFLKRPAEVAARTFTLECMTPPTVVEHTEGDPQEFQIAGYIRSLDRPVNVLDWGAGRGRLALTLAEQQIPVSYTAYDLLDENADDCQRAIKYLHDDDTQRYFNHLSELHRAMHPNPADVAVLSNVLHEIPPESWLQTLGVDGVAGTLSEQGYLLIVEDLQIPHGELAHPGGFLVLDPVGIAILVNDRECKEIQIIHHSNDRYKGRLVAYVIPTRCLTRIGHVEVRNAVEWCMQDAARCIRELRAKTEKSYREGRALALHLQQFANATLYLQSLGETPQRLNEIAAS